MDKKIRIILLVLIFLAIVSGLVLSLKQTPMKHETRELTEEATMFVPEESESNMTLEEGEIAYNYPINLSGMSKEDVLDLRKKFVAKSIFADENYSPSEEVFGEIESGKPWISLNICINPANPAHEANGPSEEARFIFNPTVLVALEHPFSYEEDSSEWCIDKINNMIPLNVFYDKENNEISVVYLKLPFITNGDFYAFNGINARDFGYKYVYVDLSKSTYQPEFKNEENISNTVGEFQNYIHVGGSCGIEGGCNNGSPNQPMMNFYNTRTQLSGENGIIYLKLWKNPPASPEDEPDIVEKIIIERF